MTASKPYTPTPVVELAFVARSEVPGISDWMDVSSDCFDARTTRGRTSEFDDFNAGTLTAGLYNDDRQFDPIYDSSISAALSEGAAVVKLLAEFEDPITLYSDNFASALADFWEIRKGTPSISSGRVTDTEQFTLATPTFEASRCVATVELVQSGSGSDAVYFALASEGVSSHASIIKYARFRQLGVNLTMTSSAGGFTATNSVTYNSTTHRWLRIEFTGTSVVYSTSPDGSAWTVRATHTDADVLANLPTTLRAYIEDAWVGGTHSQWDNFSLTTTRLPVWYGNVKSLETRYEEGGIGSLVDLDAVDSMDFLSDYVFENTLRTYVNGLLSGGSSVDEWFPFDKILSSGQGFEEERFKSVGNSPAASDFRPEVKLEVGAPIHPSSLGSVKIPSFTPPASQKVFAAYRGFSDGGFFNYSTTVTIGMWVQFEEPGSFQEINSGGFYDLFFANSTGRDDLNGLSWAVHVHAVIGSPGAYSFGSAADLDPNAFVLTGPGIAEGIGYNIFDGKPHFIVFVRDGTTGTVYWDGEAVATVTNASATGHGDPRFECIGLTPSDSDGAVQSPNYRMSDLMIWRTYDLTASEVRSLYERMRDGWIDTVTTGEAINTLLDEMNWPQDFRSIDEGTVLVQLPKELEGQNALKLLQRIVASEQGRLFIDELGRVAFHDRSRQFTNPLETTVQYSFTDVDRDTNPTDVGIVDESLSLALDDEFKVTRAEVSRTGGTVQVAESGDGRYTKQLSDLLFADDIQSLSLAEWLVFRYATSEVRADAWTVTPEVFTDDWTTVLQLGIGTKVGLEFTPNGIGDPAVLEMILGYVEHQIDDEEWTIKFHGTPADNNDYAVWDDANVGWDEGVWA